MFLIALLLEYVLVSRKKSILFLWDHSLSKGQQNKLKHGSSVWVWGKALRLTEHWNGLHREIAEDPSLEIFQSHLDTVQPALGEPVLAMGLDWRISRGLFQPAVQCYSADQLRVQLASSVTTWMPGGIIKGQLNQKWNLPAFGSTPFGSTPLKSSLSSL